MFTRLYFPLTGNFAHEQSTSRSNAKRSEQMVPSYEEGADAVDESRCCVRF